jgi:hypothetical protein
MVVLRKMDVASGARVYALASLIQEIFLSILLLIFFFPLIAVLKATGIREAPRVEAASPFIVGIAIALPALLAALGALVSGFTSFVYNEAAERLGGIQMELS